MKCDICNKNTMLPVNIEESYICKLCFTKLNGPLWKYIPHDKFKTVNKLKNSTLEKAKSLKCPKIVIDSLSNYFNKLTATMNKCDGCGEIVHNLRSIGESKLCKSCYLEIDKHGWNEDEYVDNDSVEVNRNKVLKIATRKGFTQQIINDINAHFDSKYKKVCLSQLMGG